MEVKVGDKIRIIYLTGAVARHKTDRKDENKCYNGDYFFVHDNLLEYKFIDKNII